MVHRRSPFSVSVSLSEPSSSSSSTATTSTVVTRLADANPSTSQPSAIQLEQPAVLSKPIEHGMTIAECRTPIGTMAHLPVTRLADANPSTSQHSATQLEQPAVLSKPTEHGMERVESDDSCIPMVGMQFTTHEEARHYYEEYGRKKGFAIRVRSSVKTRRTSDGITGYRFVCSREGLYKPKATGEPLIRCRSTSTTRGGCDARMWVIKDLKSNNWKVTVFSDEHNHNLVSPQKRVHLKCNRTMPDAAKSLIDIFSKENLQINKVASVLSGDVVGFNDRDCWNYLRSVRHKNLGMGDAQSVLDYFQKRQVENPQFFYAIQCDQGGRAANFFWVDAASRMSYKNFGDVVTFDTTYRTNKYDMPFASFTGVNHHFQTIQFGCALLQDETEITFVWLFQTWLQAMGGSPSVSIITDQDLAMKAAISKVLPMTRHCLCIWHIKNKFGEKLAHIYSKGSKFKTLLKQCIWGTYNIELFEEQWHSLMSEYELANNDWLKHLYEIRESWIPVYNRTTFFAGMNTTGRSEGATAFFNGFVSWNSSLSEFVVKYEEALKKITRKERSEDYESEHKYRIFDQNHIILRYASQVYTRNIFDKFKKEVDKLVCYKVVEGNREGEFHTYIVTSKVPPSETFKVKLDLVTYEGICECHHFEFIGILCRHMLVVFSRLDIDVIPSHFIRSRWTKGANRFKVDNMNQLDEGQVQSKAMRMSHICQEATKLACVAHHSEEGYKIAIEAITDALKRISMIELEYDNREPTISTLDSIVVQTNNPSFHLQNSNISQTKGRKRTKDNGKRIKSSIELSQHKKKRKCALCGRLATHDKHNCPENPQNKKEQDMNVGDEDAEATQDLD